MTNHGEDGVDSEGGTQLLEEEEEIRRVGIADLVSVCDYPGQYGSDRRGKATKLTPEVVGVFPVDIHSFEAVRIYEGLNLSDEISPGRLRRDEGGEVFPSGPSSE